MNISKTKYSLYSRLDTRKQREKTGLFIAEGEKCVADTISHFEIESLLIIESDQNLQDLYSRYPVYTVTEQEMKGLSQFQSLPTIIAVYKIPLNISDKENFHEGLTLMLDGVQDPGNLGTIIRISSWFGVSRIVLGTGCADPFNPKAVQSSMGAIGMVRIIQADLMSVIDTNPEIPVCGTLLDGEDIYSATLSLPAFVVMGNEGNGLSEEIRSRVTQPLLIPSFAEGPHAESLNVAAATSITVSEFMRRTQIK